jgi:Na+/H+ antiporter NhaA
MDKPTQTLLLVFVAVAAVSILMQAGFTVAMFIGARKARKKIMGWPMTFVCTPCLQLLPRAN